MRAVNGIFRLRAGSDTAAEGVVRTDAGMKAPVTRLCENGVRITRGKITFFTGKESFRGFFYCKNEGAFGALMRVACALRRF